jgi:ribonucleoside-diphosphate reductase alpha chain
VESPEDVLRWNQIDFSPVDYRQLAETEDRTKLADVAACAGGACEL